MLRGVSTGAAILSLMLFVTIKAHAAEALRVIVPVGAPIIVSDYHSSRGANGVKRRDRHQGIDIAGPRGLATPICFGQTASGA